MLSEATPRAPVHLGLSRRDRPGLAWLTAGSLTLAWVGIGLGSPQITRAQAPQGQPAAAAPERGVLDVTAAAAEVRFVIEVRPEAVLKLPIYQRLAGQIPGDLKEVKALTSGAILQGLLLIAEPRPTNDPAQAKLAPRPVIVLRSTRPYDWKTFITAPVEEVAARDFKYLRAGNQPESPCYRVLDDQTLLIGFSEADVASPPIGGGRPKGRHSWDDLWKQSPGGAIRLAVDAAWLAKQTPTAADSKELQNIRPLLDQARAYAVTLDFSAGLSLDARGISPDAASEARVAETLRSLIAQGRAAVPNLRGASKGGPPAAVQTVNDLVDSLDAILQSARITQTQATTRLQVKSDTMNAGTAVALLLPAVQAAREAARRAQCVNNLKRIGLAMHRYHDDNHAFPAARSAGQDGKPPVSWRVALLPYLDEKTLYNQYHLDEPWDGPNNRKLLDRMPTVYRDPSQANVRPSVPSYFALTGAGTLFPDRPTGLSLADVHDGSSTTLMLIEAKRDIPWTRPDDVAVDPDQPLPTLGGNHPGGFNALLADGSVRFLKPTLGEVTLRALVTPAGGEVVPAFAP